MRGGRRGLLRFTVTVAVPCATEDALARAPGGGEKNAVRIRALIRLNHFEKIGVAKVLELDSPADQRRDVFAVAAPSKALAANRAVNSYFGHDRLRGVRFVKETMPQ